MLANRNPDIPMYLEKYEQWKKEANEFKKDIKQGKRTEEEFLKWIEETRKNKLYIKILAIGMLKGGFRKC